MPSWKQAHTWVVWLLVDGSKLCRVVPARQSAHSAHWLSSTFLASGMCSGPCKVLAAVFKLTVIFTDSCPPLRICSPSVFGHSVSESARSLCRQTLVVSAIIGEMLLVRFRCGCNAGSVVHQMRVRLPFRTALGSFCSSVRRRRSRGETDGGGMH